MVEDRPTLDQVLSFTPALHRVAYLCNDPVIFVGVPKIGANKGEPSRLAGSNWVASNGANSDARYQKLGNPTTRASEH